MMRKVIDLVKLKLQIYVRGSGFVMPLIAMAVFLYMMYSVKPQEVVSSYLLSGTFLFLLMVWIGVVVSSGENEVTEQILLLRVNSEVSYYLGEILFLTCIALVADVVCTGFPVIQNLLNGNELFSRELTLSDVGTAFLLQGGCAFAGSALGSVLHPRVMRDRNGAMIITVILTLLSVTQTAVSAKLPFLKLIFLVLPPVMLPAERFGNADYFDWGQTIWIFILLLLYGCVLHFLKSFLCHRKKFS